MSGIETGFVNLPMGRIEYRIYGNGEASGPKLIFLHEGLGCCAMWRDLPLRVARKTNLTALAYSRPGYGASDPLSVRSSPDYLHQEALEVLPAVLKQLRIEEHILVGHSDGASIAIIYAGGLGPTTLRGLALLAPHVFVEPLTLESIRAARVAFEQGELAQRLRQWHGPNTEYAFYRWNDSWLSPEFSKWNIEESVTKIRVPILVIQGEQDQYGTLAQVESIKRNATVPVETLILPNSSHHPHRDNPEEVIDALVKFICSLKE